ncbi:hypothetical protein ATANTOWER_004877 [Ataeniobius toweri]|uniref:Uncharacterized protein n=1 Tax=Ataeniobius toweri TaxID=208326 RepID=A0ABU7BZZ9_9TELE|nr:hypothetical protein [Ataeniobius toweri]
MPYYPGISDKGNHTIIGYTSSDAAAISVNEMIKRCTAFSLKNPLTTAASRPFRSGPAVLQPSLLLFSPFFSLLFVFFIHTSSFSSETSSFLLLLFPFVLI